MLTLDDMCDYESLIDSFLTDESAINMSTVIEYGGRYIKVAVSWPTDDEM